MLGVVLGLSLGEMYSLFLKQNPTVPVEMSTAAVAVLVPSHNLADAGQVNPVAVSVSPGVSWTAGMTPSLYWHRQMVLPMVLPGSADVIICQEAGAH